MIAQRLLFPVLLSLLGPTTGALMAEDLLRDDLRGLEAATVFSYKTIEPKGKSGFGVVLESGESVSIPIETKKPVAVYLGLVTPSAEIQVTVGTKRWTIPANARFYYGVTETFPPFASIQGGQLYGRDPSGAGERVMQEFFAGQADGEEEATLKITAIGGPLRITHLRLRSLTAAECKALDHPNDPKGNRRVVYNNDGFSGFGEKDWQPQDLFTQIDRFQGTDVKRLDVQTVSAGTVQYPGGAVDFFGDGVKFSREFEANAAANYRKLEAAEMSLFPELLQRGRQIGLPVWGSVRVSAYYGDHPFGTVFNGGFWRAHPEFQIRKKNGDSIGGRGQLSFAFEEVREQQINQLVDLAKLGCEGVTVDFLMPPVLGYDEPLIKAFQEKYGEDPRQLSDHDARWVDLRCEVIGGFMRDLRIRLDEVEKKQGRELGVTVRLPAVGFRELGFDPKAWIDERLVDMLVPGFPDSEKWYDASPWVKMAAGSGVQIYGNIEFFIHETAGSELTDAEVNAGVQPGMQTYYSREDYWRRAAELYRAGVDGLYLYNAFMHDAPTNPSLNQIGDKFWVQTWSEFKDPARLPSALIKILP